MELKRIGVLSLAKIACLFGILYGLVSAILVSLTYSQVSKVPELAAQISQTSPIITTLGYYSLIALPVLNGVIYFILGLLVAVFYNLFAKWMGGIKLELAEKRK